MEKKKKTVIFIWLAWANVSLLWKSGARFCAEAMFLDFSSYFIFTARLPRISANI